MACLSPIVKPNPYFGATGGFSYLHDTVSQTISIPCGWCANCVAVRQMYLVQRIQMEAKYNHLFMFTLTYNNEHLPVLSVGDFDIPFSDMKHLTDMFKRFRNNNAISRPWRYVAVSEFGGLKGRPHFHGLLMLEKRQGDTYNDCLNMQSYLWDLFLSNWTVNVGSKRKPDYQPLCTYVSKFIRGKLRRNYDLHYVIPALTKSGITDAAFYVLKYMLKDSDRSIRLQQALRLNYSDADYQRIWSIVKPRMQCSKGFGLNSRRIDATHYVHDSRIIDYLHNECVLRTPESSPYPYFFSPDSILTFPLCPYYKGFADVYSIVDAHTFYYNQTDDLPPLLAGSQIVKQVHDFERKLSLVQMDDVFSDFNDLV